MLVAICIAILLTWAVCALVLFGIGSLVLRPFTRECSLAQAFWIGLGMVVAILEIYHFFRAIDLAVTLLLAGIGFAGIVWNGRCLLREARRAGQIGLWPILLYLALVISVALRASGPCTAYDTGLYGANAVRWIITYPAVPGLANVHERLGFNSAVFLCIGALDQGFWRDQSYHLFAGLLIAALLASLLPACFRLFRGTSVSAADWFQSILLIWVGTLAIRGNFASMETDSPTTATCFAAMALLSAELDNGTVPGGLGMMVAAVAFAIALAFKLSVIVFAALGWAVAFALLWWSIPASKQRTHLIVGCFAFPLAILLPWLGRSVVLSGYPFYPSSSLALSADWRLPEVDAKLIPPSMQAWARIPGAWARIPAGIPADRFLDTQGFRWVGPWFRGHWRDRLQFQTPVFLCVGAGLASAFALLRRRPFMRPRILWLLVPSLAGLLFWFLEAPDPRFGQAAIWVLVATLGAFALTSLLNGAGLRHRRIALAGLLAAAWWCIGLRHLGQSFQPLLEIRDFSPLPKPALVKRQTLSGLTVYQPAEGDQCWATVLLCTPQFNRNLRLRHPDDMRYGFASEGISEGLRASRLDCRARSVAITFVPENPANFRNLSIADRGVDSVLGLALNTSGAYMAKRGTAGCTLP